MNLNHFLKRDFNDRSLPTKYSSTTVLGYHPSPIPVCLKKPTNRENFRNIVSHFYSISAGNPHWRGRIITLDLLVLTSLDQFLFQLKIWITFLTKQATLVSRSTALSLPLQLVFPDLSIHKHSVHTWWYEDKIESLINKWLNFERNAVFSIRVKHQGGGHILSGVAPDRQG